MSVCSVEECRQSLIQIGLRDPGPCVVARVLAMMANTHTGLTEPLQALGPSSTGSTWGSDKDSGTNHTSWNIDIFIQTLYELVSQLEIRLQYTPLLWNNSRGLFGG